MEVSPEAARTEGRGTDWFEVAGTVMLGIAAILIAWTAYQAQLWGGVQDQKNTASIRALVDAADEFGLADATLSLDQLLFVDLMRETDEDAFDLLFSQMSPAGMTAASEWFDNNELSPFDNETYLDSIYGEGQARYENSELLINEADEANQNGDKYTLAATIIAVALFLVGLSLVVKVPRVRIALLVGSTGILGAIAIYVVTLPTA